MKRFVLTVLAVGAGTAGWLGHDLLAPSAAGRVSSEVHAQCDRRAEHVLAAPEAGAVLEESFEDQTVLERLVQEGGRLVAESKSVDAKTLVKELQFDKCQLQLPIAPSSAALPSDLYSRLRQSVVIVASLHKCMRCDRWHASPASGFVITDDGAIVTNYHVMDSEDKSTFVVMTADGYVHPVVRVLAASRADDLAIIKIDAKGLLPVPLTSHAPVGTQVGVLSHPASHFYSLTSGIVSRNTRIRTDEGMVEALEITADYARGSSGAPVFNSQGQVVGIVKSTESIYYNVESGQQRNLQMVFKVCMPAASLFKLIEPQVTPAG